MAIIGNSEQALNLGYNSIITSGLYALEETWNVITIPFTTIKNFLPGSSYRADRSMHSLLEKFRLNPTPENHTELSKRVNRLAMSGKLTENGLKDYETFKTVNPNPKPQGKPIEKPSSNTRELTIDEFFGLKHDMTEVENPNPNLQGKPIEIPPADTWDELMENSNALPQKNLIMYEVLRKFYA